MADGIIHINVLTRWVTVAAMIAAACLVLSTGCGKKGPPVPAKFFGALNPAPTTTGCVHSTVAGCTLPL